MDRSIAIFLTACMTAMAAVGCGYSEEEMQAKRQRVSELESELADARQKQSQLEQKLDEVSQENRGMRDRLKAAGVSMEQLQAEKSELQAEKGELQRAVEELRQREQQAKERLATFRDMLSKFKSMIASGKLRVRIVRGRMVVELSEDILFDSGKADLKPKGKEALTQVADVLQTIKSRNFQIAGHTDNVPIRSRKYPSNWHLSTARAVTVARFLAEQGVDRNRISAAGYADTQPVASNETPEGRQQNRRIEIVLMPNLDELPDLSALQDLES